MNDTPKAVPIGHLSLTALLAEQHNAATSLLIAKVRDAEIKAEVVRRFGESATRWLADAGKTHGTMSLPLQDGIVARGEVKRTTKWDSAKLQAIAQTLPWDRVAAMFKIEFSMPEAIYKGIAAFSPEMRQQIDAARTDTFAAPTVTLATVS